MVLFFRRAIDEVGPLVDAPKPVVWDATGFCAVESAEDAGLGTLPKSEPVEGAAAVVDAVVVLGAAAPEAGVPVLVLVLGAVAVVMEGDAVEAGGAPNKLEGFGASEAALLVGGFPN